MLDAVATAFRDGGPAAGNFVGIFVLRGEVGAGVVGLAEGFKSHGSAAVADGVEADLEAELGAVDDHLVQFVLRELGKAGVFGVVGEGGFHGGGA